jgi:hypothetical protein
MHFDAVTAAILAQDIDVRACGPKKKVAAFLDHSALDRLRDFWHD